MLIKTSNRNTDTFVYYYYYYYYFWCRHKWQNHFVSSLAISSKVKHISFDPMILPPVICPREITWVISYNPRKTHVGFFFFKFIIAPNWD